MSRLPRSVQERPQTLPTSRDVAKGQQPRRFYHSLKMQELQTYWQSGSVSALFLLSLLIVSYLTSIVFGVIVGRAGSDECLGRVNHSTFSCSWGPGHIIGN